MSADKGLVTLDELAAPVRQRYLQQIHALASGKDYVEEKGFRAPVDPYFIGSIEIALDTRFQGQDGYNRTLQLVAAQQEVPGLDDACKQFILRFHTPPARAAR